MGLRQPDSRTCGAACLVVAAGPPYDVAGFAPTVLAAHRRLTRSRLHGRWQVPWPRVIGTPPWAVARELTALTGVPHRVRLVRWSVPTVLPSGVLFVGNRWLPRHVVLVLEAGTAGRPRCYDPTRGRVVDVDLARLDRHEERVGGWRYPWFSVVPRT